MRVRGSARERGGGTERDGDVRRGRTRGMRFTEGSHFDAIELYGGPMRERVEVLTREGKRVRRG